MRSQHGGGCSLSAGNQSAYSLVLVDSFSSNSASPITAPAQPATESGKSPEETKEGQDSTLKASPQPQTVAHLNMALAVISGKS